MKSSPTGKRPQWPWYVLFFLLAFYLFLKIPTHKEEVPVTPSVATEPEPETPDPPTVSTAANPLEAAYAGSPMGELALGKEIRLYFNQMGQNYTFAFLPHLTGASLAARQDALLLYMAKMLPPAGSAAAQYSYWTKQQSDTLMDTHFSPEARATFGNIYSKADFGLFTYANERFTSKGFSHHGGFDYMVKSLSQEIVLEKTVYTATIDCIHYNEFDGDGEPESWAPAARYVVTQIPTAIQNMESFQAARDTLIGENKAYSSPIIVLQLSFFYEGDKPVFTTISNTHATLA